MRRLILAALAAVSGAMMLPVSGAESTLSRTVLSCSLARGDDATLKAVAHGIKGEEGNDFFVETRGKTERAFLDMPDVDFPGNIALAACIHNTLIFAINYGPPYLKGVAIRANPRTHTIERLYFAEKALPRWLFEDDMRMLVIVPNLGNETNKKYLIYEFVSGKGQPEESVPSNSLPVPKEDLLEIRNFVVTAGVRRRRSFCGDKRKTGTCIP